MPKIRPSADLRNKYNEISEFCHRYTEPIFITRNGQGDLAVMSIETYEMLVGKADLYKKIEEGLEDLENNESIAAEQVFSSLKSKFKK
ncbi:MAG: type II toxin-antitoxin system prevent-host-death family antitoxin [Spirochaetia bacterium]